MARISPPVITRNIWGSRVSLVVACPNGLEVPLLEENLSKFFAFYPVVEIHNYHSWSAINRVVCLVCPSGYTKGFTWLYCCCWYAFFLDGTITTNLNKGCPYKVRRSDLKWNLRRWSRIHKKRKMFENVTVAVTFTMFMQIKPIVRLGLWCVVLSCVFDEVIKLPLIMMFSAFGHKNDARELNKIPERNLLLLSNNGKERGWPTWPGREVLIRITLCCCPPYQ